MALTLEPATEQRIQRELAKETWFERNKAALHERIEEGFAQIERGEFYSADEARQLLEKARQARKNKAALAR